MSKAASYSADDLMRDGRRIRIRAYMPEDQPAFVAAAGKVGPRSRYLRFFTLKLEFSEREREFFLNVDFDKHVALVALTEEAGRDMLVGAGRYVVIKPGRAEVAFTVIDSHQGQGIGTALLRHIIAVARIAGLHELIAEVLPENKSMLHLFENCGVPVSVSGEPEVVHVTMQLTDADA